MTKTDAFSKYHPLVNFLFFVGAIGFGVVIRHPAYLAVSIGVGTIYYLILRGRKAWKILRGLIPLFLFLTAVNPLLNTYGERVLFEIFGRPYTLEALMYGGAIAGIFVNMTIWFGCYNQVLTADKFTGLFGNLIPSLSLLLVMVLRLVPTFIRKTKAIGGARNAIGKGIGEGAGNREKLESGLVILGALASWALEGSVVTGDSMRARGYGSVKRTDFMHRRPQCRDLLLLAIMTVLIGAVLWAAVSGQTKADYTPSLSVAPASWGVAIYGLYLFVPTALQIKEAVLWHISKSKI